MFFPRPHDVSHQWCHSKFPTILSLLKIENVNVLNFLIELRKVERVIIMDHESAKNLLKSVETAPSNMFYALTYKTKCSGITRWFPAPTFKSYLVKQDPNPWDFCKFQIESTPTCPYDPLLPTIQLSSKPVPTCLPTTLTPPPLAVPLLEIQLTSEPPPTSQPPPTTPIPPAIPLQKIQLPSEPIPTSPQVNTN